jgi:hypothetical protein
MSCTRSAPVKQPGKNQEAVSRRGDIAATDFERQFLAWIHVTSGILPSYLHGHFGLLRASSRHSRRQGAIVEQRV